MIYSQQILVKENQKNKNNFEKVYNKINYQFKLMMNLQLMNNLIQIRMINNKWVIY